MEIKEKIKLLDSLGLKTIAARLSRKQGGKKKLLLAINDYKYVTQEDINEYNKEMGRYNKELVVVKIKDYTSLPPDDVLEDLKNAKAKECFDGFYVAYLEKVKDPLLFGKIDGFKELYFFISQWGDDVKIEDILKISGDEK
jgi:hypothetical protein